MTILKGERIVNLYKMIGSVIVGDPSAATKKEDSKRLWHMRFGHMSVRGLQALRTKEIYQVSNITNSINVNFALLVDSVE